MTDTFWDLVVKIGAIVSILLFVGITPKTLYSLYIRIFTWSWLKRYVIGLWYFIGFVSLLTLFILWALIWFPISKGIFNAQWGLLLGIMIYCLIGIWVPIVEHLGFRRSWLSSSWHWVGNYGWIAILIGFWTIYLPQGWLWPLILTIVAALAFLFRYGYGRWKTSCNKAI